MVNSKYNKISKYEKFLKDLLKHTNTQIQGFTYLQKGYTNVTFREVFQSLGSIKKKIEEFIEE